MCIYIGEWGSLRVTHVPTPETGNGSNMGFLERFWEWFRLLVRARTLRSGSTNVQSEKYRCFIWAIWNRRSLVGFTESQGFINSVSGAASNELICQEKFMSSLMLTYVKNAAFSPWQIHLKPLLASCLYRHVRPDYFPLEPSFLSDYVLLESFNMCLCYWWIYV